MEAIGGYFELANVEQGVFPHAGGILLNTGRNALEYILRSIGEVRRVFLPYYTCSAVLSPLEKLSVPRTFYHIDNKLEIAEDITPEKGEFVIANNYFGIKDAYIEKLADQWGDHLIVDNSQAWLSKPIPGIKSFYSPRKFVGVADGGVAYLGDSAPLRPDIEERECTEKHDSHLYLRKTAGAEAGFDDFRKNEKILSELPLRLMSEKTKAQLANIDYERLVVRRRDNFRLLSEALAPKNKLVLPAPDSYVCPMVMPLMVENSETLRQRLLENKIFVARYWPDVQRLEGFETEYGLACGIIPLPCDQRYGRKEMERILNVVNTSI